MRFRNLEIRLAEDEADLVAAQTLRYKIFYDEMGAQPSDACIAAGLDMDSYDPVCDHLLVIDLDRSQPGVPCVVGTYRLLRASVAERTTGFYTDAEFDLGGLKDYPGEIMELGRSCIDAAYRKSGAMQLLWSGIAQYIYRNNVDIMFGCGSIHGTDLEQAKLVMSYLHHYHMAPKNLRPVAQESRFIDMNLMKKDTIDTALAQSQMPPLLKGYLRLGGYVGKGAVIDHEFNTIDVCVVVETANVTGKYIRHFTKDRERNNAADSGTVAE
ncbi:GNAT family N-acetyltransferase [Aestuariispira insulae]|nr:GNAT family N-acyltransferase [Aestuariispira insulae]